MIEEISNLIRQKGPMGILPNELPEKEFEYLHKLSSEFIDDEDKGPDKFSALALCVITILSHQQNYPEKIAIKPDDLMEHMHLYSVAILFENMGRKTDAKIEPPTIDNIFDENRMVEISSESLAKLKKRKSI